MEDRNEKKKWEHYREQELAVVSPILEKLGFKLDPKQPHMGGERYLMQAITTTHGKKLILLGRRVADNKRVVIKTTSDQEGRRELEHERECRTVLKDINFAYQVFFSPEEILFARQDVHILSVQAFLEQTRPFLERPLEEQFSLALKAFKAQESAHATTYKHRRLIRKTFQSHNAEDYIKTFEAFGKNIVARLPEHKALSALLERGTALLYTHQQTIEQYCGFLTHTDFVPHNFRVVGENIYLLDHSSIRFGNKYEGWARFLNFMTLYNRPLEEALKKYVRDNRTEEESLSLKLMRVYRLGEIIWYYTSTLDKISGDLRTLNQNRVEFWGRVLEATLSDAVVPAAVVDEYKRVRDSLRSEEEKERQHGLH